ncbi:PIN domain-containing protein [Sphingomonas aquatilis]|uniref:Ribonuclease VapC n=1 Tax=Sphingomonas aquatilis TaxID=93063 RepID=A0AAW3TN63_9SPHN|nr:PIN domain-containing protein [Sphingomonas aquatilis]MBB3874470.1 putative nucleic acid-binding protein [Sphingomonas aquatilis]MCI4653429.1 PIN domain-containing protein [Sphingomonas aquatilis]GEM70618.1 ribonuclease VapC [Sphingomonas aquatilis NBRC 16722]
MTPAFFDTNVLVYAFGDDARRSVALRLLDEGCVVSVQSLNELANVLLRKQKRDWPTIGRAVDAIIARSATIVIANLDLHHLGLRLAERYRLSVYDAMIAAAALTAECDTLYSEDMHDGLVIDGRVRIVNPFAPVAG